MKKNKANSAIIEQNTKAINLFIECNIHGDSLQTFLFEMMAMFTKADTGYSEKYRADCIMHFENLYNLVTDIQSIN